MGAFEHSARRNRKAQKKSLQRPTKKVSPEIKLLEEITKNVQ